ncbi:MAG: hypothetical protein AAGA92_03105 [Planctomycetota bacterium]
MVDESADYSVETVYEGLDRPTALAVRRWNSDEAPHEFFIAESGSGTVRQVLSSEPPQVSKAVEGLSEGGPLAVVLTTRTRLLVGTRGGASNFLLPRDATTLRAGEPGQPASIAAVDSAAADFYGLVLAEGPARVFAVVQTGGSGAVLLGQVSGNRVERFGTLTSESLRRPRGVALSPSGRPRFVVVADSGGDEPADSSLHFYKPHSGELVLSLPVPLDELCGVAYSPRGELYAVNGASRAEGGGVYRLDEVLEGGRQSCQPALLALLTRPTDLVFGPDGLPYAIATGELDGNESGPTGALYRVSGDFE